jgi:hypothetical protein
MLDGDGIALRPAVGTGMNVRICALVLAIVGGGLLSGEPARASSVGYAYCGTYGSYVLMYKSDDQLEELGKLRCGEKVEVLSRWFEYAQVRTVDGRVGWVHYAEISNAPGITPTTNFGLTDPSAKPQGPAVAPLNNASIVKMRTLRLSSDVMVAKIQSSPCEFETSPAALQKLKQAGVPDKVILAMVMAASSAAAAAAPVVAKAPAVVEVKIPGNTPVNVELTYAVSSDDAVDGRVVLMTVAQDVTIDGVTVFQHGAEAHGRVTTIKQPGFLSRPPGEFAWTMEYVTAVNGDRVPANFFSKDMATNPMTSVMGAAGPSWEFKKGKPAVVPAGTKFETVMKNGGAVVRVIPPPENSALAQPDQVQAGGQLRRNDPSADKP